MLNKKMLLSILIIGTVAVVAGAGTWAQFTAQDVSTGNTFTAGTMVITAADTAFGHTGMFPSQQFITTPVNIANDATSPDSIRQLNMTFAVTNDPNSISQYIRIDNITVGSSEPQDVNMMLPALSAGSNQIQVPATIAPGSDVDVSFGCTFLETAPDTCQGGVSTVDITFVGSQFESE